MGKSIGFIPAGSAKTGLCQKLAETWLARVCLGSEVCPQLPMELWPLDSDTG